MKRATLAVALAACTAAASAPAGTAVVAEGDVVDRVLLTGAVHATNALELVVPNTDESQLAIRWLVADGTPVKAGDRVFELDSSPFTSRLQDNHVALAGAETQFRVARAQSAVQLGDKRRAVRQREIDREKAKLRADLPQELVTGRAAQENRLALVEAEAELTKARQEVDTAAAEQALEDKIREIDLDKTRRVIKSAEQAIASLVVTAPRDGVVVIADAPEGHKYKVGDTAQQGNAVVSLPDLGKPMEVRAELSDVDDGRVAPAMTGTCTLDAYPDAPITCSVATLAPVARPKLGRDSLRRAFDVTLAVARVDARLRPGMSVKVELARTVAHGPLVPRAALLRGERDRIRLGSGELRDVVVAACDAQHCAIAKGIVAGDVIATGGAS